MKLLVIRHAIAMDREEFAATGQSDDMRPLTGGGAKKMKKTARGLRTVIETIDGLATSPFTRAVQTAEIVAEIYGMDDPEVTASLVPGVPFEEFETWCNAVPVGDVLAVVGHEPHLSSLVTWLLTGKSEAKLELKKGGACLIEFDSAPRRDSGMMKWLLTPAQLRELDR